MTRSELISDFRAEVPECTSKVASDTVLNGWAKRADKLICALTRCIVTDVAFNSVATSSVYETKYDLTHEIPKFYDIDDFPGGGVSFDDDPLEKTTVAELDAMESSWRTRGAGTPKKWYRRGKYLYFDYPIEDAGTEIRVYAVLISDDFDNDDITPYNQLDYLEPFHPGINEYLKWQAKRKIGKPEEVIQAQKEFFDYVNFMKKTISGNKFGVINFQPRQ